MPWNMVVGWRCLFAKLLCLSSCISLASCESLPFGTIPTCNPHDPDGCNGKARVCETPTVQALARDLDELERHIEKYGSVVAQHPDVWGQARLTKHREDFENEMYKELGNFKLTLQGSVAWSDQAYAADAVALSNAAAAAGSSASGKGSSSSAAVVSNSNTPVPSPGVVSNTTLASPTGTAIVSNLSATKPASTSKPASSGNGGNGGAGNGSDGTGSNSNSSTGTPDQSDTFGAFGAITRTPVSTVTGPTYSFLSSGGINVEPEVYLDQKARYINYLNQLRRNNEGDDTADSPGYALDLVRIPVSIFPGKCTEIGHGAEITMTLTPHLSEELLPTTFRNLIINDLVEQISYPVTQFINNPENSIYLDDRRSGGSSGKLSSDVAALFGYVDDDLSRLENGDCEAIKTLQGLRLRLALQPLFGRSEWDWVDDVLKLREPWVGPPPKASGEIDPKKPPGMVFGTSVNQDIVRFRKEFRERDVMRRARTSFQPVSLIPATKSRRAMLPFPPTQMVEVYGYKDVYQIALEAYRGLSKERFAKACLDSDKVYIHLPDIEGYLQEELNGVYKLLENPCNVYLWHVYCTEELANAVRSHQIAHIRDMRNEFKDALIAKAGENAPLGSADTVRESTIALAWATIVESALLTQQLVQDMKESAAAKGCPIPHEGWLPYFLPDPPIEARMAFNEYVRCRWPIHVFALDPVTQQQNISDTFSGRREMQLAMSLAFVSGKINAKNMMRYARRIEFDLATIDLNNTQVGFSHGDETFGWRFYPRFQTPDIESNAKVFFRDLLWGGPNRNALLRQRRLEPGQRECVAIVMMPSFVPYADLTVNSNWFSLTNPKCKLMDTEFAMRVSKSVKTIENCGARVLDADCYCDGDLALLLKRAKQLASRRPLQGTTVQIPYENTLGGFGMFNTGVTDLAPELSGWYGSPSINPIVPTTIFLVGNHFSVHQTRVIAAGNDVIYREMLSRQVMKVVIPPNPNLVGNPNQKFVDIQLATPYGLSQHLLVPVCIAPCPLPCPVPCPSPCGGTMPPVTTAPPTSTTQPVGANGQPSTTAVMNAQSPAGGTQPSSSGGQPSSSGGGQPSSGAGKSSSPSSKSDSKNSSSKASPTEFLFQARLEPDGYEPPVTSATPFISGGSALPTSILPVLSK